MVISLPRVGNNWCSLDGGWKQESSNFGMIDMVQTNHGNQSNDRIVAAKARTSTL